jgi:hypothetical protein
MWNDLKKKNFIDRIQSCDIYDKLDSLLNSMGKENIDIDALVEHFTHLIIEEAKNVLP